MPGSFLTSTEINQMKQDFKNLLASPEASTVTLRWIIAHSVAQDTDYDTYPATDVPTWQTKDIKSIVKTVGAESLAFIRSGILEAGDKVFYIDPGENLTGESLEIVYGSTTYHPILTNISAKDLLGVPLGDFQMAQVIAASRKARAD